MNLQGSISHEGKHLDEIVFQIRVMTIRKRNSFMPPPEKKRVNIAVLHYRIKCGIDIRCFIYIYIYIHICVCVYIYIYIYVPNERRKFLNVIVSVLDSDSIIIELKFQLRKYVHFWTNAQGKKISNPLFIQQSGFK